MCAEADERLIRVKEPRPSVGSLFAPRISLSDSHRSGRTRSARDRRSRTATKERRELEAKEDDDEEEDEEEKEVDSRRWRRRKTFAAGRYEDK